MRGELEKALEKAQILVEALPYIQQFNRKVIVIKYGGSAMSDESLQQEVIKDVTLLKLVGFKPVLVHGGGKEISALLGRLGKKSSFVGGLRVTDEETMEVAEMVLDKIGKRLVTMVESLGVKAVGISGKDGNLLHVKKRTGEGGADIGYVGEICEVRPKVIYDLLEKDYLPIVAPIGLGDDFHSYNINADDAACEIAKAMQAEKLAFLTDIEGLYRDMNDRSSFLSRVSVAEAKQMMAGGMIGGGMLPKLAGCIGAMEGGVNRVHILDGRVPHSLLLEIFTQEGMGTMILKDEQGC